MSEFRATREFPNPVLAAIRQIREESDISRWFEWRPGEIWQDEFVLHLLTLGETKNSSRIVWRSWSRQKASEMAASLWKSGLDAAGRNELGLDIKAFVRWYLPRE